MFLERLYQEARWLHIGTFSEAWDQGFEEGYDQGFEEGYKKGQEEISQTWSSIEFPPPAKDNKSQIIQRFIELNRSHPVVFDYDDFLPNKLKRKP